MNTHYKRRYPRTIREPRGVPSIYNIDQVPVQLPNAVGASPAAAAAVAAAAAFPNIKV